MLNASIDMRNVEDGFRELLRTGESPAPVLRELKKPLREDQREHQRAQQGPGGRWPQLAASTLRRRGRTKSGRPRRRPVLGRLPGLLTIKIVGGDALIARSRVRWARIHQEGGRTGRGGRIPARPWLYFDSQFVTDTQKALTMHMVRKWGRK